MAFSNFEEHTMLDASFQFTPASGTSLAQLTVTSLFPQRIDFMVASNGDTIDHVIKLVATGPGGNFPIGSATIPAGSGHGGLKGIDVFALALPTGVTFVQLPNGWSLSAGMEVAITAAKDVCVFLMGGYF